MKIAFMTLLITLITSLTGGESPSSQTVQRTNAEPDIEQSALPDLVIDNPTELFIEERPGVRNIRFNTKVTNIGQSPLVLTGRSDNKTLKTVATQHIQQDDGSSVDHRMGEFVFHAEHTHWHTEKFNQFQLWSIDGQGKPVKLLASTDKLSFCIWDMASERPNLEGAPETGVYVQCGSERQGLSVGWSDTYSSELPGQELNILDVRDGTYAIVSVVNPDRKILESNYDNNGAISLVEITDNSIRELNKPQTESGLPEA